MSRSQHEGRAEPASLEDRLDLLESERDIRSAMHRYAFGLDYGPEELFLSSYTDNGSWIATGGHRRSTERRRFEGLHGLVLMYRHHTHAPGAFHKHLLADSLIEIDGDEARVDSYYSRIDEHPSGPWIRVAGRYRDLLRRCPDGTWRLESRRTEGEPVTVRDFPPAPWTDLPPVVR